MGHPPGQVGVAPDRADRGLRRQRRGGARLEPARRVSGQVDRAVARRRGQPGRDGEPRAGLQRLSPGSGLAVAKARVTLSEVGGSGRLELRFNPKELTIDKSTEWNRKPAKGASSASKPEFAGAHPRSLKMELLFDDWNETGG